MTVINAPVNDVLSMQILEALQNLLDEAGSMWRRKPLSLLDPHGQVLLAEFHDHPDLGPARLGHLASEARDNVLVSQRGQYVELSLFVFVAPQKQEVS